MDLAGRTAVVTGAAGGIGSAISQRLVEQGALVHGLDCDWARPMTLCWIG
jgi:NAD(P)-dependent dehydrogenase (short-subunit alcohol dehydrogenase family)